MKFQFSIIIACMLWLIPSTHILGNHRDTLWQIWTDSTREDSTRLRALQKYSRKHQRQKNPDSAFLYAKMKYEFAERKNLKKAMAEALNTMAISHRERGLHERAIALQKDRFSILRSIGDSSGMADVFLELGISNHHELHYGQANEYFSRAMNIHARLKDTARLFEILRYIGLNSFNNDKYAEALKYANQQLALARQMGDNKRIAQTLNALGNIYRSQNNYDRALEYFKRSIALRPDSSYGTINNLGLIYLKQGKFKQADKQFRRAYKYYVDQNWLRGQVTTLTNIGSCFRYLQQLDSALHYYSKAVEVCKTFNSKSCLADRLRRISETYLAKGENKKAISYGKKCLEYYEHYEKCPMSISKTLYKAYKNTGQIAKALEMHELHLICRDSSTREKEEKKFIQLENQYRYEKQALADSLEYQKREELKNIELQRQQASLTRQRIALFATIGGLLVIIVLSYVIYKSKKRSDELLLNILPSETARELKTYGYAEAKNFEQVTVLFTDFKDFTRIAEQLSAQQLVSILDECFRAFDRIIEQYGIEKIKTIGDSYMAAGGLPVPDKTNAERVVRAALEMREFMLQFNREQDEIDFEMRIGIHTGSVVAGIVGIKKFQYDIWGDTVNTASRMESHGEAGKVNISNTTYEFVKDSFRCTHRGKIHAKNKGAVDMYFVEG